MGASVKRVYETPAILQTTGIIGMPDIAKALSAINPEQKPWTTERARKRFVRAGLAFKFGGRWVVTIQRFKQSMPDVWFEVRMRLALADEN